MALRDETRVPLLDIFTSGAFIYQVESFAARTGCSARKSFTAVLKPLPNFGPIQPSFTPNALIYSR